LEHRAFVAAMTVTDRKSTEAECRRLAALPRTSLNLQKIHAPNPKGRFCLRWRNNGSIWLTE
jgi:hypothetical protein